MDASILSANLRRARVARGKSQGELAEAAGLSRVGYRTIEAGEVTPRIDTLMKIAGALGVRVEDLLAPVKTLTHVRFRAQKKMTAREELLVTVARDLEHYKLLERLLPDEVPAFGFGAVKKKFAREKPPAAPDVECARQAAAAAREAAGLDHVADDKKVHETVRNICGLLEFHGVKVLTPRVVASEGFFGLSIAAADGGPAVVVNTWDRISVERWIFTAAHELGHLILHPGAYDVNNTEENDAEETEANIFASYFLMPPELFVRELEATRGLAFYDRVMTLKRRFDVSWQTVLFRMTEKEPTDTRAAYWKRFFFEFKNRHGRGLTKTEELEPLPPRAFRAFESGAPTDRAADEPKGLTTEAFVEDRRHRLVRLALDRDLITMSKAADILNLSTTEMRKLANDWLE